MKEIPDAQKIRTKVMDCIETALFKDQSQEEKDRLLHMVSEIRNQLRCISLQFPLSLPTGDWQDFAVGQRCKVKLKLPCYNFDHNDAPGLLANAFPIT